MLTLNRLIVFISLWEISGTCDTTSLNKEVSYCVVDTKDAKGYYDENWCEKSIHATITDFEEGSVVVDITNIRKSIYGNFEVELGVGEDGKSCGQLSNVQDSKLFPTHSRTKIVLNDNLKEHTSCTESILLYFDSVFTGCYQMRFRAFENGGSKARCYSKAFDIVTNYTRSSIGVFNVNTNYSESRKELEVVISSDGLSMVETLWIDLENDKALNNYLRESVACCTISKELTKTVQLLKKSSENILGDTNNGCTCIWKTADILICTFNSVEPKQYRVAVKAQDMRCEVLTIWKANNENCEKFIWINTADDEHLKGNSTKDLSAVEQPRKKKIVSGEESFSSRGTEIYSTSTPLTLSDEEKTNVTSISKQNGECNSTHTRTSDSVPVKLKESVLDKHDWTIIIIASISMIAVVTTSATLYHKYYRSERKTTVDFICKFSKNDPRIVDKLDLIPVKQKIKILLLYPRDCQPFTDSMKHLRDLLKSIETFKVLDPMDPEFYKEVSLNPYTWGLRHISDPTVKIILAASWCSMRFEEALLNGQSLSYSEKQPIDNIFSYLLHQLFLEMNLSVKQIYIIRLECDNTEWLTYQNIPKGRIFTLPQCIKSLIHHILELPPELSICIQDRLDLTKKLEESIKKYAMYLHYYPSYLDRLLVKN